MPLLFLQREGTGGIRIPLDRALLRAGRSADNEIHLGGDPHVSRFHAEFVFEGGRFLVRDAGSRYGTLVNGVRIAGPWMLSPGDRITLGKTVIHFINEGDPDPLPQPAGAGIRSREAAGGSSARTAPDTVRAADDLSPWAQARAQTVDLGAQSVVVPLAELVGTVGAGALPAAAGSPALASRSRAFDILSEAAEGFLAQRSLDEVLPMVMEMVRRAASPDRAALMLLEGDPPALRSRAIPGSPGADGRAITVSRTISDAVLRERQAILTSDAMGDPRFAGADSVVLNKIRSAMCVPLWNNKEVIGLIYVDTVGAASAYSREDLQVLTLVANLAAVKIENARLFLRDQQMKVMERELAAAARIQQRLLPAAAPPFPGWVMVGRNVPCLAVGGDYFDLQLRGPDRLGVAVGDVSGKGLPAAILMATVQAAFRALLGAGAGVPEVVSRLNATVVSNSGDEKFLTFFCGELDRGSGRMTYVNAGHNPPILLRAGGAIERLFSGGLALGLMDEASFPPQEVLLADGDLLVLFSDGITESQNTANDEYGDDRFIGLLRDLRGEPLPAIRDRVLEAVRDFAGAAGQFDDITLVLLRREAGDGRAVSGGEHPSGSQG
jgi:serine phosphatase RsbU (regulator of sigma subunit)